MKQIKFNGYNNHKIVMYCFDDIKHSKGVVLIIHDLKQSSKNYFSFAKYLNQNDYIVYCTDIRLHGKTAEENNILPIKADYFKDIVNDHYLIIKYLEERYYKLPVILIGNGFCSYIVNRLIEITDNINIAIMSGSGYNASMSLKIIKPFLNLVNYTKLQKKLAKTVEKLVYYSYNKKFENKNWLTNDEKIFNEYLKDTNYKNVLPVNFYTSFFNNIIANDKNINNINKKIKILLISGSNDPVNNKGKNLNIVYNKFTKCEISTTLKIFENMKHNIFEELNKDEVYKYVLTYLNKNIN